MIKSLLSSFLPERYKLLLKENLGVPSQLSSFKKICKLGFSPKFCLDIGAYNGNWTKDFKKVFPGCAVLMFEAQESKADSLNELKALYNNVDYKIALLGATENIVKFNIYDTASSVLIEHHNTGANTEVRNLSCLDNLVGLGNFSKPDFIKIDTQGYELEILKGGEKTLNYAEFVLLEVSFLDIYVNCPLLTNTLCFMKAHGFVVYDICTLMKRPLDNALFQSDFLFVKENSVFRSDKRWS